MTTALTEERLAEIEARAKAATGGDWAIERRGNSWMVLAMGVGEPVCWISPWSETADIADAKFIAHARDDVPDLAAEVRRLRALVAKLEWGSCDGCGDHRYCPLCGGYRSGDDSYPHRVGHRDGCPVLGPPSPS